MSNPIKAARNEAKKISQEDLSNMTGLSQAQISRYEKDSFDIEEIPYKHLKLIAEALGVEVEDLLSGTAGSEFENLWYNAFTNFDKNTTELINYLGKKKNCESSELDEITDNFIRLIKRNRIRPIVGLHGHYDAGKSYICNKLIKHDILPASYQPETSLVQFLVHSSYKPGSNINNVTIYRNGFNFEKFMIEGEQDEFIIEKGGYDILNKYSINESPNRNAVCAVVFINAPVLESVILCDTPGYSENEEDENSEKATSVIPKIDALIFVSRIAGFMSEIDREHLKLVLEKLKIKKDLNSFERPFDNVLIVASHAHPGISDEEIKEFKEKGANRLYTFLKEQKIVNNLEYETKSKIRVEDYENIITPFWFQVEKRRLPMQDRLLEIFCTNLPRVKTEEAVFQIDEYKKAAIEKDFTKKINNYQRLLSEKEEHRERVKKLVKVEPKRKKEKNENLIRLKRSADDKTDITVSEWLAITVKYINKAKIKAIIKNEFSDKSEAQHSIGSRISNQMLEELKDEIEKESEKFADEVNEFIETYNENIETAFSYSEGDQEIRITFDAFGAFAGGLAGAATLGAFSVWAATLGNLGGYIVTAKLVSILSALGISIGGTGAVAAFIAALGGPITIFTTIGIIVGLIVKKIFGESWESRLAGQVVRKFNEKNFTQKIIKESIKPFWRDTKILLDKCAENIEKEYQFWLEEQIDSANSYKKEILEQKLAQYENASMFYKNAPKIYNL